MNLGASPRQVNVDVAMAFVSIILYLALPDDVLSRIRQNATSAPNRAQIHPPARTLRVFCLLSQMLIHSHFLVDHLQILAMPYPTK